MHYLKSISEIIRKEHEFDAPFLSIIISNQDFVLMQDWQSRLRKE